MGVPGEEFSGLQWFSGLIGSGPEDVRALTHNSDETDEYQYAAAEILAGDLPVLPDSQWRPTGHARPPSL
jgi:hypothetical protein